MRRGARAAAHAAHTVRVPAANAPQARRAKPCARDVDERGRAARRTTALTRAARGGAAHQQAAAQAQAATTTGALSRSGGGARVALVRHQEPRTGSAARERGRCCCRTAQTVSPRQHAFSVTRPRVPCLLTCRKSIWGCLRSALVKAWFCNAPRAAGTRPGAPQVRAPGSLDLSPQPCSGPTPWSAVAAPRQACKMRGRRVAAQGLRGVP